MLSRILLVCLSLRVVSAASSLSCRWITDHKFRQHSENYLELLDTMANNSTNSTEDAEDTVSFPDHLYSQASKASLSEEAALTTRRDRHTNKILLSIFKLIQVVFVWSRLGCVLVLCWTSKASAEDKLAFTAQVLNETAVLFEEDHSSASWEENTVENLLNVVTQQADELRSCIGSHGHKKKNKKLHMYFQRLSSHVLKRMGHSAEAWELIRKEVKAHLMRAHQLVSSVLSTN